MESYVFVVKFDLSLFVFEMEEGLLLIFEYNIDLFNDIIIECMVSYFKYWLN